MADKNNNFVKAQDVAEQRRIANLTFEERLREREAAIRRARETFESFQSSQAKQQERERKEAAALARQDALRQHLYDMQRGKYQ